MKKKGFSESEHQEIGRMLVEAYEKINNAFVKYANAYPRNSEPVLFLKKSLDALSKARDKADDTFYKENPDSELTHVYFGNPPNDE